MGSSGGDGSSGIPIAGQGSPPFGAAGKGAAGSGAPGGTDNMRQQLAALLQQGGGGDGLPDRTPPGWGQPSAGYDPNQRKAMPAGAVDPGAAASMMGRPGMVRSMNLGGGGSWVPAQGSASPPPAAIPASYQEALANGGARTAALMAQQQGGSLGNVNVPLPPTRPQTMAPPGMVRSWNMGGGGGWVPSQGGASPPPAAIPASYREALANGDARTAALMAQQQGGRMWRGG